MDELLGWAPYLIGAVFLLMFPLGRKILGWFWAASIGLLLLLIWSEPDLTD